MQHRGHPDRLGAGAVLAQVIDEHAVLGVDAEPLSRQQVDLRLRLVKADLGGDHCGVEQGADLVGVVVHHPGV
jgi:hypothetical protein